MEMRGFGRGGGRKVGILVFWVREGREERVRGDE